MASPRKKDGIMGLPTDEPSSGFIRLELDVSTLDVPFINSPEIEVQGMLWRVCARKNDGFLQVYLVHSASFSNLWSVNTTTVYTLLGIHKPHIEDAGKNKPFNHENLGWGSNKFISWEDLINEEKGFVKDNKIVIEVRFILSNIVGIRSKPVIDFTDVNEPRHDITLMIEGEKIYANKAYLSLHSPFFNAMFYGDFDEKDKKEIELIDVNRKEFNELLNVIYPSRAKITDENSEYLLKLGDRFQINLIFDLVEEFLITSDKLSIPERLKISDQYRLVKLQDHCLDTFKTFQDIKKLKATEGYEALSDKARAALMGKAMTLE